MAVTQKLRGVFRIVLDLRSDLFVILKGWNGFYRVRKVSNLYLPVCFSSSEGVYDRISVGSCRRLKVGSPAHVGGDVIQISKVSKPTAAGDLSGHL